MMQMAEVEAKREELREQARLLSGRSPLEVLRWAAERYQPLAFLTGFGPEGCVIVDHVGRHRLPVEVLTLDTGLLFAETHALWARLERLYGIRIRAVKPALTLEEQAARFGDRLWEREPDRCCQLRKVEPLRAALRGYAGWVTGIRRDQTAARAKAEVVEWDEAFGLVKVNPLVGWTRAQVWDWLREHGVPFNPLHEQGYPSIGCIPCTTPVAAGEDARAGRWRGREKTECGLHARPRPESRVPANGNGHGSLLLPAFLKLAGRSVVVVGAGKMAAAKIEGLLAAGAQVTVVAPDVRAEIEAARVRVVRRGFEPSDLDGAWFVIAAATADVNARVAEAAEARRVFVNAVDDPARASAYAGGVLRRDGVTVAVSTDGAAPALAGLLREALDAVLPQDVGVWVDEARRLRQRWLADGIPMPERRPLLLSALNELYARRAAAVEERT